jgi:Na+-transporting NADH:ubiquinone oxidoreductase subunit A
VHRGERRRFRCLEIELDGDQAESYSARDVTTLTRDQAIESLVESGWWTALRTRPFNKVPDPSTTPSSIFVTAIDTQPLALDAAAVIAERSDSFIFGLHTLTRLTDGAVYVCHEDGKDLPGRDVPGVTFAGFSGPHPAGLPGTHIHFLDPVGRDRTVWFVGYQDVIAYGSLITAGRWETERVISLAGPAVNRPRWVRTRLGACIDDLVAGELQGGESQDAGLRVISGSVLSGRTAAPPVNFLGRYHTQVTALREGTQREFMGWSMPGLDKFSATAAFASAWLGRSRKLAMTTSLGGSRRAMVPIGVYEKVMPMDLLPTQLLRALLVGETEDAQALGCLELDEDDLALCTFVCPSKYDYGPILRENLTKIELEG